MLGEKRSSDQDTTEKAAPLLLNHDDYDTGAEVTTPFDTTGELQPADLSKGKLLCIAALSLANGYALAVLEALSIPYLLVLGMPFEHASALLFISPAIVLVLWAPITMASDQCTARLGRRKPFLIGLLIVTLGAYCLMGLANLMGSNDLLHDETVSWWFAGGLVVALTCQDLTMLLHRALANDLVPDRQRQITNVYVTAGYFAGSMVGRLIATVHTAHWFPQKDFAKWAGADFVLAFWTLPIVMVTCSSGMVFLKERPVDVNLAFIHTPASCQTVSPTEKIDKDNDDYIGALVGSQADLTLKGADKEPPTTTTSSSSTASHVHWADDVDPIDSDSPDGQGHSCRLVCELPWHFWNVWSSVCTGYMLSFCYLFFWTSFVATAVFMADPHDAFTKGHSRFESGVDFGAYSQMVMGMSAAVVATQLHRLNYTFGTARVFFAGQLGGAIVLSMVWWLRNRFFVMMLSLLYGAGFSVFMNNALLMVEKLEFPNMLRKDRYRVRAFLLGVLQSSKNVAQMCMALIASLYATKTQDHFTWIIVTVSALGIVVQVVCLMTFYASDKNQIHTPSNRGQGTDGSFSPLDG